MNLTGRWSRKKRRSRLEEKVYTVRLNRRLNFNIELGGFFRATKNQEVLPEEQAPMEEATPQTEMNPELEEMTREEMHDAIAAEGSPPQTETETAGPDSSRSGELLPPSEPAPLEELPVSSLP